VLPANHALQIWTKDEERITQVQFTGPGNITYINRLTIRATKPNNQAPDPQLRREGDIWKIRMLT
jgi:hypothetical protein